MQPVQVMERHGQVRTPRPAPSRLPPPPIALSDISPPPDSLLNLYEAAGALSHLQALEQLCGVGLRAPGTDCRSAMPLKGGAAPGMQRLQAFLGVGIGDGCNNHHGVEDDNASAGR